MLLDRIGGEDCGVPADAGSAAFEAHPTSAIANTPGTITGEGRRWVSRARSSLSDHAVGNEAEDADPELTLAR